MTSEPAIHQCSMTECTNYASVAVIFNLQSGPMQTNIDVKIRLCAPHYAGDLWTLPNPVLKFAGVKSL